ncbi:MAG: hypothetical protein AUI60_02435 [Thaumarchaeota archaeon 13_1_40CM_2_39_4]|nr:MAG: hypothetical protein AUI60_02435 [Thaumarchaeota archaeon 13_1_40CM_2_39_4]
MYLDQEKYPGFFAWVIPTRRDEAKVGVAGKGINAAAVLEDFLEHKGKHSTIRKIFAPIWVKGPIKEFVTRNVVTIGDAAGQSKPTTAGGIYSCGIGGMMAGKAISKFLKSGNETQLSEYQKSWLEKFGKKLFESITPQLLDEISKEGSFDFHTISVAKLLGVKGSTKVLQAILGNELRRLLT